MKRTSTLLRGAFALLTALILATPAAAYDDEGVTLYKDVHFTGRSETFYGDVPDLRGSYVGNDRASSLVVPRGCRVTLYRHAGFHGRAITVHHDVADLGATRVGNDEVSSLRLDCYGGGYRDGGYRDGGYRDGGYRDRHHRGVTVFADADFRGRHESFSYDDPDLRDNYIRQDTISSVRVAPGCRAVLFDDVGFRGAATVVRAGDNNLGYSAVGNDRVSSIQVDCRRYR
jgi:hypothetical protein